MNLLEKEEFIKTNKCTQHTKGASFHPPVALLLHLCIYYACVPMCHAMHVEVTEQQNNFSPSAMCVPPKLRLSSLVESTFLC